MTAVCMKCRVRLVDGRCKACGRDGDGTRELPVAAREAIEEAREAIQRKKGKR